MKAILAVLILVAALACLAIFAGYAICVLFGEYPEWGFDPINIGLAGFILLEIWLCFFYIPKSANR